MKSMTGFSEASLHKDGIQFKCFVKSLNSRFIEINIRLPNSLKKHEGGIRDAIKKNFARGKIEGDLYCTTPAKGELNLGTDLGDIKPNETNRAEDSEGDLNIDVDTTQTRKITAE